MSKSQIIFYKNRVEIDGISGTFLLQLHMSLNEVTDEVNRIIDMFNEYKITTLFVPISLCTGWKTKLTKDECIILFTDRFLEEQMMQAKNRISWKRI